ncbi:MAG TPA: hypothetical protein VJ785_16575 [Anaerolineales bacterium]|nr:hypothetical protein [Anaerolineales bacterium]
MGRTLPSATQLILEEFAELKPLYNALRRGDQLIFDKFFDAISQHRAAIDNARNLLPMEMIPFAILLEERKRNNQIFIDLYSQIEELDKRLIRLLPPEEGWTEEP